MRAAGNVERKIDPEIVLPDIGGQQSVQRTEIAVDKDFRDPAMTPSFSKPSLRIISPTAFSIRCSVASRSRSVLLFFAICYYSGTNIHLFPGLMQFSGKIYIFSIKFGRILKRIRTAGQTESPRTITAPISRPGCRRCAAPRPPRVRRAHGTPTSLRPSGHRRPRLSACPRPSRRHRAPAPSPRP